MQARRTRQDARAFTAFGFAQCHLAVPYLCRYLRLYDLTWNVHSALTSEDEHPQFHVHKTLGRYVHGSADKHLADFPCPPSCQRCRGQFQPLGGAPALRQLQGHSGQGLRCSVGKTLNYMMACWNRNP